MADKVMDHAAYQQRLKELTPDSLRWIIKDAQEAIDANPPNPNNGYYRDEILYCHAELRIRERQPACTHCGYKYSIRLEPDDKFCVRCGKERK